MADGGQPWLLPSAGATAPFPHCRAPKIRMKRKDPMTGLMRNVCRGRRAKKCNKTHSDMLMATLASEGVYLYKVLYAYFYF